MAEPVTEAQIREIYRTTVDAVYGYASRKCDGQRELAEDVTQETWLRAVREWRLHGIPDAPLAWLTTVARNLLLNHFRRQGSVPLDSVSPAEILEAMEHDTPPESPEVAELVRGALARIPADQARLIEAFHYDRTRVAQIAETTGVSERAVEGRLRRARQSLRRELEITLKAQGEPL